MLKNVLPRSDNHNDKMADRSEKNASGTKLSRYGIVLSDLPGEMLNFPRKTTKRFPQRDAAEREKIARVVQVQARRKRQVQGHTPKGKSHPPIRRRTKGGADSRGKGMRALSQYYRRRPSARILTSSTNSTARSRRTRNYLTARRLTHRHSR
jgi:regulator of protease activity HflC (stomatin/prohibitin superfamily)